MSGEVVSGSFFAYEANGTVHAVRRYVFRYVVRGGAIVSGQQHSVSGSPPAGMWNCPLTGGLRSALTICTGTTIRPKS